MIETARSVASSDPLVRALVAEGATQCGFCTPGILMSLRGALRNAQAGDEIDVTQALAGNVCRCTGYSAFVRAVERARADV